MGDGRNLTSGELAKARPIFGASLDYSRVKVHNEKAYFFQPNDTAITPNGEIYFPPEVYKADFSLTIEDAAWLIHELVHVYQHQIGMWVRVNGALYRTYKYGSLVGTKKVLKDFRIEQQASIVEDYFRKMNGLSPWRGDGALTDYERVITFLPRNAK
jgi:Domain of unknown function (DUF4157)